MIIVRTANAVAAWRQVLAELFNSGPTDNQLYFRDEMVVVELSHPSIEPSDPLFPMSQGDLDVINHFIWSGEGEDQVAHEWTVLYHHRMFDEPNSQIRFILSALREDEPLDKTVVSLWDKDVDQDEEVAPCTLVLWARKRHGKLDLHVHAHSSDAYKKLLMNLQEFISLHLWLARQVGIEVGTYTHVLDSCHIHRVDADASAVLVRTLTGS